MKILYHFRTQGTGAEAVHIAGMARAFESLGFSVVFSSPSGVDPRQTAGSSPFRKRRVGRLVRAMPGILFELLELAYNGPAFFRNRRLLRAGGFAFIYERHAFFLFATALVSKLQAVPFVVEVNELAGDERVRQQPWLAPVARMLDRVVFKAAALVVVVSPHLERRIAGMGIDRDKILVLPNGVHLEEVRERADGSAVRRRFGLDGCTVLGFVGWFVPWHRLDRLIAVLGRLLREHPAARLLLVGEGPGEADLRDQIDRLGIAGQVVFAGPVSRAEVQRHIAAFDIAVVPHSNAFRSPIKLFEYMAQARAVVAPATEPIAEVVTHGASGLLFDPESEEGLQECLEAAISDPQARQEWGEAARERVLSCHTWESNGERVWERLQAHLSAAPAKRAEAASARGAER